MINCKKTLSATRTKKTARERERYCKVQWKRQQVLTIVTMTRNFDNKKSDRYRTEPCRKSCVQTVFALQSWQNSKERKNEIGARNNYSDILYKFFKVPFFFTSCSCYFCSLRISIPHHFGTETPTQK